MSLRETLGLPAGAGIVLDALLNSGDVLMQLGTEFYSILAVTTGWVAPELPWLNQELLGALTAAAATLHVLNVLESKYDDYTDDD